MKRFLFGIIIAFTIILWASSSLLQKNNYFNTSAIQAKTLVIDNILEYSKMKIIKIIDRLEGTLNYMFEEILFEKDDLDLCEVKQERRTRNTRKSVN